MRYLIFFCLSMLAGCNTMKSQSDPYQPQNYVKVTHPEWSENAVLYQINTRQFTPDGTFEAAAKELPRLKDLGVDILWLMPIHPIGEMNRKGTLGSPYSVKDYLEVNPEFGTIEDLKGFVASAHALGMKVILDWVANHTAWDNPLREAHPDWYARDYKGDFRPTPWWDWSDIIDLDYRQPALRKYMTDAMVFWVREVGIDGYRCDVAGFVPVDFWEQVRRELDAIKPVFMLAEWESRDLHANAFDATYAWSWSEKMHRIVKGEANTSALYKYYSWNESAFPRDAYRMVHVENHDTNAWDGSMYEIYGDALEAAIVLSVVGEGLPMIHNGQEAGNEKRLAFFEKDPIHWREHSLYKLYQRLFELKHTTSALWNGEHGTRMINVPNNVSEQVFSFVRQDDNAKVFVVINLSDHAHEVRFSETLYHGDYSEVFSQSGRRFDGTQTLSVEAWGYRVFIEPQQP